MCIVISSSVTVVCCHSCHVSPSVEYSRSGAVASVDIMLTVLLASAASKYIGPSVGVGGVGGVSPLLIAISGTRFLERSRHTLPLASMSYQRDKMERTRLSVASLSQIIRKPNQPGSALPLRASATYIAALRLVEEASKPPALSLPTISLMFIILIFSSKLSLKSSLQK